MPYRPHVLDNSPCWCNPRLLQVCPECHGQGDDPCARCADEGLVLPYTDDPAIATFVVHDDPEDG